MHMATCLGLTDDEKKELEKLNESSVAGGDNHAMDVDVGGPLPPGDEAQLFSNEGGEFELYEEIFRVYRK